MKLILTLMLLASCGDTNASREWDCTIHGVRCQKEIIVVEKTETTHVIEHAGQQGERGEPGLQGEVGQQGPQGQPGQDAELPPYVVVEVVDPCGDTPNIIDEVLLVLANGQVLASFSDNANGNNTRFSIVPPGQYVSTDGSSCQFTVQLDGEVVW